mmetsp:Transcript_13846/g.32854  ORF Transcript_13846/g.32854 Transcript_13846/m.32854 type:complete len:322 (-) Transcript_13846:24-989(-)
MDAKAAGEPWVHFMTDIKSGLEARPLFTHWYTFFLFEDYGVDLHMKRLVRDYLHYNDEVFCAGAKVAKAMDLLSGPGGWSAMHVRHGELQYTNVQFSPSELMEATRGWLGPEGGKEGGEATGEALYVATDEADHGWFAAFEKRHSHVRFLSDFEEAVRGVDPSLLGMVEQVVMSRGRTFTGTWFSTFSAYACRLRGYYQKKGPKGARFLPESCFVYAPAHKRLDFKAWKMPQHAFYPREWALAWEGIDFTPPPVASAVGRGHQGALDPALEQNLESPLEPGRLRYKPLRKDRMVYPDAAVAAAKAKRIAEATKAKRKAEAT